LKRKAYICKKKGPRFEQKKKQGFRERLYSPCQKKPPSLIGEEETVSDRKKEREIELGEEPTEEKAIRSNHLKKEVYPPPQLRKERKMNQKMETLFKGNLMKKIRKSPLLGR